MASHERLLRAPEVRLHQSLISAVQEFDGARMDGAGPVNAMGLDALQEEAAVEDLVARLTDDRPVHLVDGSVPASSFWMVRSDEVVGFLQIRHRLTPFLLDQGGHIGYSVRPSARRRGLATEALREALLAARGIGLEQVLVACGEDNVGSRSVIERAGGVHEDTRRGLRRYWIDTAASGAD